MVLSTQEVVFADENTPEEITTENIELVPESTELVNEIINLDLIDQTDLSLEISPAAIDNENYYPGTKTYMKVGDILYSSKTFLSSTKIVGHVAIVGPYYRIYHVNPTGSVAGKRDTLTTYRDRHDAGETIYVYRPSNGATGAANWASNNYSSAITNDIINLKTLSTISHCQEIYFKSKITSCYTKNAQLK
ncbi:MAG TPA: hypothetical protein VNU45_12375 [Rummeliibacillus sp.]|nr:hypothetical protein [Rummeliibacillus sp.]